jgi:hypothetical protein
MEDDARRLLTVVADRHLHILAEAERRQTVAVAVAPADPAAVGIVPVAAVEDTPVAVNRTDTTKLQTPSPDRRLWAAILFS